MKLAAAPSTSSFARAVLVASTNSEDFTDVDSLNFYGCWKYRPSLAASKVTAGNHKALASAEVMVRDEAESARVEANSKALSQATRNPRVVTTKDVPAWKV